MIISKCPGIINWGEVPSRWISAGKIQGSVGFWSKVVRNRCNVSSTMSSGQRFLQGLSGAYWFCDRRMEPHFTPRVVRAKWQRFCARAKRNALNMSRIVVGAAQFQCLRHLTSTFVKPDLLDILLKPYFPAS